MKDVYLVIPSLEPSIEFVNLISNLKKEIDNIIVINDGSSSFYDNIFKSIEEMGVIVIHHSKNFGKGFALKTAFKYLIYNHIDFKAVVTADSDGQHRKEDIIKVAELSLHEPGKLVLGVRDFNKPDVPFKNKWGNKITIGMFKMFIDLRISDTQTGLRGFSNDLVEKFIGIKGDRFEYETEMLIYTKDHNIPIVEMPITTVYSKDDYVSHFHPIRDSYSIYKFFGKYIFSSLTSTAIDLLLFTFFCMILDGFMGDSYIFIATFGARLVSAYYNYLVNAKLIFKHASKKAIVKFFILAAIQMGLSAIFVFVLNNYLTVHTTLIKIVVDLILFFINFAIQRTWVFKD